MILEIQILFQFQFQLDYSASVMTFILRMKQMNSLTGHTQNQLF